MTTHGVTKMKSKQTLPKNKQDDPKQRQTASRRYSGSSAKQRFADCALIEIIHLHDCLRGALVQIQDDVQDLVESAVAIHGDSSHSHSVRGRSTSVAVSTSPSKNNYGNLQDGQGSGASSSKKSASATSSNDDFDQLISTEPPPSFDIEKASDIANSIASRFHLVWSVFQAHSGAEDEFIWPALKVKIHSKKAANSNVSTMQTSAQVEKSSLSSSTIASTAASTTASTKASTTASTTPKGKKCGCESIFEHEEYEEDHEIEQTMFKQIETTLRRLQGSFRLHAHVKQQNKNSNSPSTCTSSTSATIQTDEASCLTIIKNVINQLKEQTQHLIQHLLQHLEKEETQCLPMVQRHLSNEEISNLVGNIMGQRSADVMTKILNLAVCSLPTEERQDMVKHMKKAMVGTFFEKWLSLGGWEEHQLLDRSSHKINNIHLLTTATATNRSSSRSSSIPTSTTANTSTTTNNNNIICDKKNKNDNETTCNNSEKIFTSTSNNTTCTDVQNDSSTRSSTISCDAPVKRPREVDQDSDEMDLPPTK